MVWLAKTPVAAVTINIASSKTEKRGQEHDVQACGILLTMGGALAAICLYQASGIILLSLELQVISLYKMESIMLVLIKDIQLLLW